MRHAITLLVLGAALFPSTSSAADVTFNRDIRPILSENCFACHGFDAKKRKAELRLDTAEGASADHEGTVAIKPRDLNASELWQRINSDDPNEVMPPPSTKKTLTAAQKDLLRRWIEQGAAYQKHWAFEAPVKSPEPAVKTEGWARNPVDRFILARLEHEGLAPRPEADRSTLIRRVAFALTGLPPTAAEVAAYEADKTPEAYEHMVDRYLASPRFGEEMGRHWLDVARYADTHGLHLDNERSMWAYRDWVIQAFNRNEHFDDFTIDQLAGDLVPNPTPAQLVATGFNRCNVTTSEGGAIDAEFLYRYAVDRTSTMTQTWMGLTGGCAVCHDHKYDPLSTREFYSLYAFFYSASDPAMDRNTDTTDPFYKPLTPEQQANLQKYRDDEAVAQRQLEEAATRADYHDPADAQPAPEKQQVVDVWLNDVFPKGARTNCSSRNASLWQAGEIEPPTGRRALRQASANNYQDKFDDPLQPFVIPENAKLSIWVRVDGHEPPETLKLELTSNRGTKNVLWGDPAHYGGKKDDKRWLGVIPPVDRWELLEIPLDRFELQPGDVVRGVALAQWGGIAWWDGLQVTGDIAPATDLRSSFRAWWNERAGKDTPGIPGDVAPVLKAGPEQSPAPELREKLLRFYLTWIARPVNDELRDKQTAWLDAQSARAAYEDSLPGTFIFKELEKPREAFVMLRGQYDKPGDKVEPGVPAIFPPLHAAQEGRPTRLDLARWLLSPEHPLTARVTVNRFWQQFFGVGLVKTSYDFGSQGELPSHPELLDWLAVTYRENGWDTKALVRLLVTSATFRQDARVSPELLRRDPENRLYARGPRFRLDAEQIRDNALFVGGLLNLEMGGRGVNSYQPPNIWEPVGYSDSNTRFYLQDHGPSLYRRSIYAFLKRTAPPPFMSNFDAPNREQFCTRRERSNTPLQALQLLNDTQHFEAARGFAERILKSGGATPAERIEFAYQTALSRTPRPEEVGILQPALEQFLARYRNDPDAARKAIAVGETKPRADLPETELAAYTLLANLVLNLDETVTRN
ncbi:MAG TPA: PSD1 and planctomycete cytochrome C domain-containing protein [Planctomycetaceae bacterium]|nr:PSD1 and planctomycete cytochrome C domain-containing protein [Planctomycetaceae bacterium]